MAGPVLGSTQVFLNRGGTPVLKSNYGHFTPAKGSERGRRSFYCVLILVSFFRMAPRFGTLYRGFFVAWIMCGRSDFHSKTCAFLCSRLETTLLPNAPVSTLFVQPVHFIHQIQPNPMRSKSTQISSNVNPKVNPKKIKKH